MAGFGRSGKWFSINHFDVVPDLLTFAKGVNSGYVPLGGVAISPAIYETFAHRPYPGGLTYSGGHPLATAAAVATINAMADEAWSRTRPASVPRSSDPAWSHWPTSTPPASAKCAVRVCSGRSSWSRTARLASRWPYGGSSPAMNAVIAACKAGGLLPFANFNRIHVVPPCNVSEDEAREGLAILDSALDVADAAL